jgi:hypothetical protein
VEGRVDDLQPVVEGASGDHRAAVERAEPSIAS